MEKVIVDGKEVDVKFEIKQGKIVLIGDYVGHGGSAKIELGISADYFLDELKAKIPGTFDDAIIEIAKQSIKAL